MFPENSFGMPAGWYADPLGIPQLRWWNGEGWTEHVAAAAQPAASAASTSGFGSPAAATQPAMSLDQLAAPQASRRVDNPSSYDARSGAQSADRFAR